MAEWLSRGIHSHGTRSHPVFGQLAKEKLPGVNVFSHAGQSLIRNTIADGGEQVTIRRLLGMIESAHQGGPMP